MRKFLTLVTLLTLMVVLAACGGTTGGDSTGGGSTAGGDGPDVIARNWFTAYLNGDPDTVASLTCAAQSDVLRQGTQALADAQAQSPVESEIDLSALTFNITSQTDTSAVVTAAGSLRITTSGQTMEQPIDQAGVPPTLDLVREDNAWKVCPVS